MRFWIRGIQISGGPLYNVTGRVHVNGRARDVPPPMHSVKASIMKLHTLILHRQRKMISSMGAIYCGPYSS